MSFVAHCQQENVKDTSLQLKLRAETYILINRDNLVK